MDENKLVISLHKFTGCSIAECHEALILAMQYLKLRHPIGDHPEEASKHEYELVPKDYISKSEQWLKELTEYKQLNKYCDYCHCDKEGYVNSIDKRGHVFVDSTIHEGNIIVNFNGLSKKYPIKYCPMCGRKF